MTEAALLEALRDAMGADTEGSTTAELANKMGVSILTMRERIRLLIVAGKAKPVKVRRARLDGIEQWVSGYRLVA